MGAVHGPLVATAHPPTPTPMMLHLLVTLHCVVTLTSHDLPRPVCARVHVRVQGEPASETVTRERLRVLLNDPDTYGASGIRDKAKEFNSQVRPLDHLPPSRYNPLSRPPVALQSPA
jgi:hypothetical protein